MRGEQEMNLRYFLQVWLFLIALPFLLIMGAVERVSRKLAP